MSQCLSPTTSSEQPVGARAQQQMGEPRLCECPSSALQALGEPTYARAGTGADPGQAWARPDAWQRDASDDTIILRSLARWVQAVLACGNKPILVIDGVPAARKSSTARRLISAVQQTAHPAHVWRPIVTDRFNIDWFYRLDEQRMPAVTSHFMPRTGLHREAAAAGITVDSEVLRLGYTAQVVHYRGELMGALCGALRGETVMVRKTAYPATWRSGPERRCFEGDVIVVEGVHACAYVRAARAMIDPQGDHTKEMSIFLDPTQAEAAALVYLRCRRDSLDPQRAADVARFTALEARRSLSHPARRRLPTDSTVFLHNNRSERGSEAAALLPSQGLPSAADLFRLEEISRRTPLRLNWTASDLQFCDGLLEHCDSPA